MLTIYTYARCSTCRRATQWLREHGIQFVEKSIRETPPTVRELETAAKRVPLRRLFNTSGEDYREQGLAEKLDQLGGEVAIKLLNGNGNLVKRPFVIRGDLVLVGFKEEEWSKVFSG